VGRRREVGRRPLDGARAARVGTPRATVGRRPPGLEQAT